MKCTTQTISTALSLLVTVGLMVSVAAIVVVLKETHDTTTLLGNTAHLSQELRQSSDDLTRFIRTFTVTNNQSYWNYFLSVISIRNGDSPLPVEPWRNHWDLFIVDGVAPRGFGTPNALRARIKDALFTTDEIALLDLAQSRSDALIDLEDVANNAMRGKYRPTNTAGLTAAQVKAFSVTGTPNQTLAMELVHGIDYHREKGGIMKPLDDFAAKATKRVKDRADLVFFISIGIAVLIAFLSFLSAAVAVMTHFYQGKQLHHALDLAQHVAKKLAIYDTDGAKAALDEALRQGTPQKQQEGASAGGEAGKLDASNVQSMVHQDADQEADVSSPVLLIANALTTITDNMTLFRPHLPGWLIEQTQATDADEGDGDELTTEHTGTPSDHLTSSHSNPGSSVLSRKNTHASSSLTDLPSRNYTNRTSAISRSSSNPRASHIGALSFEISRVVLCQLSFEITTMSGFAEVMHAVSDAVHGAATKTSAAVHGFACDTVMVSWGAARKVVQPDAKAASFMLKVRAALEGNEHVTISAAALSGEARPMLAGRGNQQALSVYTLWRPALEAAAAYARATKSLVVGRGVDRDAKYVATIRAVAAIAAPKPQTLQEVRKSCYARVSLIAPSGKSGSLSPPTDLKKKSTVVVEPSATPPGRLTVPGAAGSDDGDDGGEALALRSLNGSGGKDKLLPVPTALGRHRSDPDATSPVLLEPSPFPATNAGPVDPDSVDEISNTTTAAHEAAMVSHGSVLKSHGRTAGNEKAMVNFDVKSPVSLSTSALPDRLRGSFFQLGAAAAATRPVVMETIKLYEVSERKDAEDEWLYVVDGKGNSTNAAMEESLERVLEDPSSAVEVLAAMQALPEEVLQAATVQWLLGRLQAIADGQADSVIF